MDHEEWRNAYLRATGDDIVIQLQALLLEGAQLIRDHTDEIERLKAELVEAKSEIQRLQSIARY